ncbi:hypothetical protein [Flagellimonas oceanensis]|uniref:hypothetical protein n=1 Tax=Flagellimonas oceanensis TaxID=2499163 RepID=UPI000F8F257D|nr:hypothetical protein [Allomuricauda oceanensis]
MSGLVHELIINYLDDSAIVFELEGYDNQNDSESSFDEDIVELGIIEEHSLFITEVIFEELASSHTYLISIIQLIGISQPTPPPEHLV